MTVYSVLAPKLSEGYGLLITTKTQIPDLTPNREAIERFVRLLNKAKLRPEHLDDALEEFLSDRDNLL